MRYTLLNEIIPFFTPIEQIFYNRGISIDEINHYKNVSIEDTYSSRLLENIREGACLLAKHIGQKNKVGILVDCDADGFTSSALLTNYLNFLYPSWVSNCVVHFFHQGKQHGLADSVPSIIQAGVKLIIVPDAGGGDGEYVEQLKKHNIETLIIDHHHTVLEECGSAIVINNQLGQYPNTTLSGAGVVYKFCEYLDECLLINLAPTFLDLVAVGCVADLMPLTNYETLYYIREGLKTINNPFIKAMVKEQEYSINKHGGLDPYSIGFYIAPFINATIRVGTMEEKEMLFKSMLDINKETLVESGKRGHKGEQVLLAEEVCRICANIKTRQTKLRDENLAIIEKLIEERKLLDNKMIIVQLQKELQMDKNILGLIANILMDKYQRPILLLNETEENDEPVWAGSVRNYKYNEIEDLRQFLADMPQTLYAQGHASAFGISIPNKLFDSFIKETNKALENFDFSNMYRVDFIFGPNDEAEYFLQIADLKQYYGTGFEEPYIAIQEIHINENNLHLMSKDKNPTIKIILPNGVELMKFKSSQEEYESLLNTVIDIVGKCSTNVWMGRITPQVLIEDYTIKRNDF